MTSVKLKQGTNIKNQRQKNFKYISD